APQAEAPRAKLNRRPAPRAKPGASDVGDYLAGFERRADGGTVVARERLRHRLTRSGDPIALARDFARKRRHSVYCVGHAV
ncbi:MAG: hypothetical protein QOE31_3011, partial [Solirubrobacteraceae bacterium]|nr:hypothetical protein [Solirubrobacteraceae bacterium]